MIYLDNAATTRITEPVLNAMMPYLTDNYGNPSASYMFGKKAHMAVENARKQFAKAINAKPEQIFFTSGATESNNMVRRAFNGDYYCSPFEHPSMDNGSGYEIKNIYDELDGLENFKKVCENRQSIENPTIRNNFLIACQYVNSETGYIFNIKELCALTHRYGYYFHCDMTAAFGHLDINIKDLNVDFASFSGHKFHAPKGVGVLYIKDPEKFKDRFDIIGGGQENGLRSGTENVASIVGLGTAAMWYNFGWSAERIMEYSRDLLINLLFKKMPCSYNVNMVDPDYHVSNIVSISIEGIEGDTIRAMLDTKGICISTGTACHSKSLEVSNMIKAFHLPDNYNYGTIRISMSVETTEDEIETFVDELAECCRQLILLKGGGNHAGN